MLNVSDVQSQVWRPQTGAGYYESGLYRDEGDDLPVAGQVSDQRKQTEAKGPWNQKRNLIRKIVVVY